MHLRATGLELAHELLEIGIKMIDGVPLDLRGGLPGGLPVPVARLFSVPRHLVLLERCLNQRAMPQVVRQALGIMLELPCGGIHCEFSTSAR